jgi:hypothetical protein
MEIFTNTRIKISESLTDSKRSYIATIGNLHPGFASMFNQVDIRKLLLDTIDVKKIKCEIVLHCSEITNDNNQLHNSFNRLIGTLSTNKISKTSWISCGSKFSFIKWNQLKNDILKMNHTFELAFQISDISFTEIIEDETNIECNVDFGLDSYEIIRTAN